MAANEPFHLIQGHVVLNNLDQMFENLKSQLEAIETNPNMPTISAFPQVLRFTSHLIIILRSFGVSILEEDTNFILKKYIELLQSAKKVNTF